MSESEGIVVDFNSNDTFSKIKSVVEAESVELKPKPKRKPSKKDITAEPVEAEPVEDKPKLRRSTKKIIVEPVEPELVDIEDIKPKPKAKRKPKKEIIVEDLSAPVEELLAPVEELPAPVEEAPKKNIKTLEQVECPKCEKPITKTNLRYHHDKSCPGEKVNKEEKPVKKRVVKDKTPEVIEPITYKERLNQKIKIKQESIKKLAANIA